MTAVFLKVLNMSIMAGWLILAAAFVRLLLKKAPKWIRCLLWILVAVRLVCPISIRSAFSLIPSSETIPADITVSQVPAIRSGISIVNETVNPVIAGTIAKSTGMSVNPLQQLITAAAFLWIAGITGMLVYAFVSGWKLRKTVAASILVRDRIMACDEVRSPFILGIFRPVIYIPSSMSRETLDYVVRHELAHLKRYDHCWKPLGYLLLSVYWFNPLCWLAYILFCRDIELACDEKVIRAMDRQEMASYSRALLDCSIQRRRIAVCPLAFGEVGVKERIKGVLNYKKPAFWSVIAAVLICVIVAGCFMTTPESGSISQTKKESQTEETVDLTLDRELSHRDEFVSFLKTHLDQGDAGYEASEFSAGCIPEDAEFVRIDIVGEVIYLDYQLDGVRYIEGYRIDGTVEKTARVNNGKYVYYIDSDHPEPETMETFDLSFSEGFPGREEIEQLEFLYGQKNKTQDMNDSSNIIAEVHQVILDYYAAYIEIYKGADIHIIENYLDMDRIQSQNIVSALEMADFSRKYISDEYGIEPEIKDDYPYTVNFLNTSFNGENTCNIRLSIDMEATAYPPAFSASEQEYQLEKENDSWKITHHTWDGMAVFEVSDTELINWDREARISILQSIYGNGK